MATHSEERFSDQVAGFAPVPFQVGYNRKQGESFVYGCVIFGLLIAVVGVAAQVPYLALGCLVPLAIAFWHYPMIEKGVPQLAANKSGLFVERLGQIDWAAIQRIELRQTSVRNIILVRLEIILNRPLQQALVEVHQVPVWKNFMMRNWKLNRKNENAPEILLDLHPLTGSPEDIISRVRSFKNR